MERVRETAGLLERVRSGCAEVAERAQHVRIERSRLKPYASSLDLAALAAPALDPRYHFSGESDDTAAYVLTLDAVNFGSGYFPHLAKRPGLSGYSTVALALKERFEAQGPLGAPELASISAAECSAIFGQEEARGPAAELMGLFTRAWNDFGRFLLEDYGGRFGGPVESAGGSAERLLAILAAMPFYKDEASYGDLVVPFYKRAQLTAADLALALGGEGLGRFEDLDRLTIFADNLVPHVLHVDGVLRYAEPLARTIARGEVVPAGSSEEVEIRACSVHAAELLLVELRARGAAATAAQLDYLLWNRGQGVEYKSRPRHRTRTVFY